MVGRRIVQASPAERIVSSAASRTARDGAGSAVATAVVEMKMARRRPAARAAEAIGGGGPAPGGAPVASGSPRAPGEDARRAASIEAAGRGGGARGGDPPDGGALPSHRRR